MTPTDLAGLRERFSGELLNCHRWRALRRRTDSVQLHVRSTPGAHRPPVQRGGRRCSALIWACAGATDCGTWLLHHPREKALELYRFYREFMRNAPPEVGDGLILNHAPPAPFVPPEMQGKPAVAIVVAYFGAVERGLEVLAPLRAFGAPPVDIVQSMPYVALQSMIDAGNPHGRRHYWRSENLVALSDETIDALIACGATATSPFSVVILIPGGGAVAAVPDEATPLGGRSAPWQYHCYGTWTDNNDASHISWVRSTEQAMRSWSAGRMSLNFISEANNERVRAAYGPEKYKRLVALKDKYDPENVFRMNQNIQPTAK